MTEFFRPFKINQQYLNNINLNSNKWLNLFVDINKIKSSKSIQMLAHSYMPQLISNHFVRWNLKCNANISNAYYKRFNNTFHV